MPPRPQRVPVPQDDIADLDELLTRMDQTPSPSSFGGGRPARPLSMAFPSRPNGGGGSSSRASSNSRLSTQSSNRSLQSLASAQESFPLPVPPVPSRQFDGRTSPAGSFGTGGRRSFETRSSARGGAEEEEDDDDDSEEEAGENDLTPNVSQHEWTTTSSTNPTRSSTSRLPSSAFPTTTPRVRSTTSTHPDSSSSIYSLDPPPSIRSLPPSPRPTSRSSPQPPSPSLSSSTSLHSFTSPLRLIPRSPLNERTPLEDLAFFKEMGGTEPESDTRSVHSNGRPESVMSTASKTRNQKLREDIEKTAQQLRVRASREELERRSTGGSTSESSVPLYPGAPTTSSSLRSVGTGGGVGVGVGVGGDEHGGGGGGGGGGHNNNNGDSASILSHDSSKSHQSYSHHSLQQQQQPPPSSSLRSVPSSSSWGDLGASSSMSTRPRQRELQEWSQSCWVWVRINGSGSGGSGSGGGSGGGGMLSKAPLIREVPAAMKRKMAAKRESSQLLSPAEALLYGMDESDRKSGSKKGDDGGGGGGGSGKDKKLYSVGPSNNPKDGSWRKVTGVLRDDGYFRVFSEDKVLLHSLHLPSIPRTDIRPLDHSLFTSSHCIVIYRRHSSSTPFHLSSTSTSSPFSSTSSPSSRPTWSKGEEPLHLRFPNLVATQSWLVMSHCFARPEFFTQSGMTVPKPLFRRSISAATGKNRRAMMGGGGEDDGEGTTSASEVEDEEEGRRRGTMKEEDDTKCRIYRSLVLVINEGRGIGELGTEVVRPSLGEREGSNGSGSAFEVGLGIGGDEGGSIMSSPSKGGGGGGGGGGPPASVVPRLSTRGSESRSGGGGSGSGNGGDSDGLDTFVEVVMEGEVVARTSVKKGTASPFWNETFVFSDLPPLIEPLLLRIYQTHKSSRPTLIGTSTIRTADLPRSELVENWWCVKPWTTDVRRNASDTVGELSLRIKVAEEVVLPSKEYEPMLQLLNNDPDADLATDIAHEFPSDLEEVTKILLRVYQAESHLLPRILRLADLEVGESTKSAAILFRGNSILTKSVELYLRLIGGEYLEASIGEPVRRLCAEKIEFEIDPMKMKPGTKEKELQNNVHALLEWSITVWNSIYDARHKCPDDLRQIFGHIQKIVVDKYGDDHKNTRWTSVSAFIFLRFFVPAVLNPKLFGLVPSPPDPKSQRSLTLIAKTLQGLANFSSFGQKEPWMFAMNGFVQDNTSAFVDFIEHIATPTPHNVSRQEWTSASAPAYLAPYRLRNSLPPLVREGVPLLPHLIDLPRDLGLLASHIARGIVEKGPPPAPTSHASSYDEASVASSSRTGPGTGRSAKFADLAEACIDLHEEARRRGGGLVSSLAGVPVVLGAGSNRVRARGATNRGGNAWSGGASLTGRPGTPSTPPPKSKYVARNEAPPLPGSPASTAEDIIHIRAQPPLPPPPPPPHDNDPSSPTSNSSPPPLPFDSAERGSIASRRSHRSFTINRASPRRRSSIPTIPGSLSTDDLNRFAAIPSPPQRMPSLMQMGEPTTSEEEGDDDDDGPTPLRRLGGGGGLNGFEKGEVAGFGEEEEGEGEDEGGDMLFAVRHTSRVVGEPGSTITTSHDAFGSSPLLPDDYTFPSKTTLGSPVVSSPPPPRAPVKVVRSTTTSWSIVDPSSPPLDHHDSFTSTSTSTSPLRDSSSTFETFTLPFSPGSVAMQPSASASSWASIPSSTSSVSIVADHGMLRRGSVVAGVGEEENGGGGATSGGGGKSKGRFGGFRMGRKGSRA